MIACDTKHCARCDTTKPTSDFYRNVQRKDGVSTYCRPCHRATNPPIEKGRSRKYRLLAAYGMTEDDYNRMYSDQDGKCAICKSENTQSPYGKFCIDHCHESSIVRGLLCNHCNRALGLMQDNPNLLTTAAEYLLAFEGKNHEYRFR